MTSAPAAPRYIHCILFLSFSLGCSASRGPASVTAIDLIRQHDRAERRPAAGFSLSTHQIGDSVHPAILAPVPSRIVWALSLPERAVFRAFVAARRADGAPPASPVRLRTGISDHRIYEGLTETMLQPGEARWIEVRADLSAYAGWKWSLFYRPDRVTWRLVLSADATGPGSAVAVWGSPEILTDSEAAKLYQARAR